MITIHDAIRAHMEGRINPVKNYIKKCTAILLGSPELREALHNGATFGIYATNKQIDNVFISVMGQHYKVDSLRRAIALVRQANQQFRTEQPPVVVRRRGRPAGSKNKNKGGAR